MRGGSPSNSGAGPSGRKPSTAAATPSLANRLREALAHVPPGDNASLFASVRAFTLFGESPDQRGFGHSERVATYALELAAALSLDSAQADTVRLGSYLHDLGMMRVPPAILNKRGRLTPVEFDVVKRHPGWGLEMLEGIRLPVDVTPMVRWHHEKPDGTGYPDGLRGDAIPLQASLVALAEVFDALTTARSYRPRLAGVAARSVMYERRGWWLPEVYRAFSRIATGSTQVAVALRGGGGGGAGGAGGRSTKARQ